MAQFTTLPMRPLAEFARTLQQGRDTDHYEASIVQLLHVLRAKFDQDEKAISANLLHYQDAIVELQTQKSKVQFALPDESIEAETEQRKPRVYPVTPKRPGPEALAKLMEVSYTEWSDSAYEDTTGDSKLAEWLASFVNKDLDLLGPDPSPQNISPVPIRGNLFAKDTTAVMGAENSLDYDSPQPFLVPAFTSPRNSSNSKGRHLDSRAGADGSSRRRALSDPPTPSKRDQQHARSRSASYGTISPAKNWVGQPTRENDQPDDSSLEASFIQPAMFSPFSLRFLQPLQTANPSPSIPSPPITPSTPNFESSPVQFFRSSITGAPLRHLVHFGLAEGELSLHQTPSNTQGFADLSGVHAFNLSLQHVAKSPFLIRTWKRMLGELTGRFPLSLSDYTGNRALIEGDESLTQLEAAFANETQEAGITSHHSPRGVTGSSAFEISPVADVALSDIPRLKTHADVLLDREYAGYLRGSISTKQKEVRCLHELIAQREKTIERMEFALKRRALEVLGSHES